MKRLKINALYMAGLAVGAFSVFCGDIITQSQTAAASIGFTALSLLLLAAAFVLLDLGCSMDQDLAKSQQKHKPVHREGRCPEEYKKEVGA